MPLSRSKVLLVQKISKATYSLCSTGENLAIKIQKIIDKKGFFWYSLCMSNYSKLTFSLNEDQEQVLIGTVLGDGHLGSPNKVNPYFSTNCCIKDKDYIWWKYNMLKSTEMFKRPPYEQTHHSFGKLRQVVELHSRASHSLLKYYNWFYPNGVKRIPREILDRLQPLGLAVWFMDDGCFSIWIGNRRKGRKGKLYKKVNICMGDFLYEDVELSRNYLLSKFGLDFKIYPKLKNSKGLHILAINKRKGVEDLVRIISPYIVSGMERKIGFLRNNL